MRTNHNESQDLIPVAPQPQQVAAAAAWSKPPSEEPKSDLITEIEDNANLIAQFLPSNISIERWMEMAKVAILNNHHTVAKCHPQSVVMALTQCAQDGLLPDGREAFLIPRWDKRFKAMALNYQPAIPGYRRRLTEAGVCKKLVVNVVKKNDEFYVDHVSGDVVHKSKGYARGEWLATYARMETPTGEVYVEVMDRDDIDSVQRLADDKSPAWRDFPEEMSRKTVLRRLLKSHPIPRQLQPMTERENVLYNFPPAPQDEVQKEDSEEEFSDVLDQFEKEINEK